MISAGRIINFCFSFRPVECLSMIIWFYFYLQKLWSTIASGSRTV
jgi:hypothetical protein